MSFNGRVRAKKDTTEKQKKLPMKKRERERQCQSLPERIAPKDERSKRKRVASSKRIKKMAEQAAQRQSALWNKIIEREREQPKNNNKNKKTKKRELEPRNKNKNSGQFVRIE